MDRVLGGIYICTRTHTHTLTLIRNPPRICIILTCVVYRHLLCTNTVLFEKGKRLPCVIAAVSVHQTNLEELLVILVLIVPFE